MVAGAVRRRLSADGLRPLSLSHDWRQVIQLIEIAFGEELDAEARRALRSMRLPPLLSPLIGLADSLSPPGEGMMPGFVWVQDKKVVGTASVRRIHPFRQGWLISNVAVHPTWQGRGIGRALLQTSLDMAADYGAAWVVLQVRDDNPVARQLYGSLGFKEIGRVKRMRRMPGSLETPLVPTLPLRTARWSEGKALLRLARALTSSDMLWADTLNRDVYQTGPLSRWSGWLKRYRRRWWVHAGTSWTFKAAVGVETDQRNPWHRLRLLVLPEAQDEQLASDLITFGLAQLTGAPPLPVEVEHPAADKATQAALVGTGFDPLYALVHMRLNLR
jgi:ribosomal protein S18 acetylase RimI-like enzyme